MALLLDEPERAAFAAAVEADPKRLVSAPTVVEAGIVLEARLGEPEADALDLLPVVPGAASARATTPPA